MAVYAIGDIQGCLIPFEELLEKINFDPVLDQVWLTGDLVNRGPDSLQALRFIKGLGNSAVTVLGNHDLHFLAVARKIRNARSGDTLKPLLRAPDLEELVDWLRQQPLVHCDKGLKVLMSHAGVYPGWSKRQLMLCANQVEKKLRGKNIDRFLEKMYGSEPETWCDSLRGSKRLRFITNALTRMRYCDIHAKLDFDKKNPPDNQNKKLLPWFEHPDMKCKKWRIVFGHWSALGYLQKKNIISLDSGCVWGGKLTAVRLDAEYQAPTWELNC